MNEREGINTVSGRTDEHIKDRYYGMGILQQLASRKVYYKYNKLTMKDILNIYSIV